jgi:ankyrin repeat protein
MRRCVRCVVCADQTFYYRSTPLHLAAGAGHACVCRALVAAGCDVDSVDKDGWSSLAVAVQKGLLAVVQVGTREVMM